MTQPDKVPEPTFVVVSHEHEPDNHVYRVVVAEQRVTVRPMLDEEGRLQYGDYEDVEVQVGENEDGNPEIELQRRGLGDPLMEQVTETAPIMDFVFADEDDRWKGKSDDEIMEAQHALISKQVEKHKKAMAKERRAAAKRRALTEGGQTL